MGSLRLARSVSLIIVITVIGALMLRGRARRVERTIAAVVDSPADASVALDSARAARLAVQAYEADLRARGESPTPTSLTAYSTDSAGFRIELSPRNGGGGRVEVRVGRDRRVELRHLAPLGRD